MKLERGVEHRSKLSVIRSSNMTDVEHSEFDTVVIAGSQSDTDLHDILSPIV